MAVCWWSCCYRRERTFSRSREDRRVDIDTAGARTLDAAEELFYGKGVHAVGMDEIRAASGVSLKRIYRLFPTKGQLLAEVLRRRDVRWRARLAEYVAGSTADPRGRLLAVFDWLHIWFTEPD